MNERIDALNPYPFERLRALFSNTTPNANLNPISLGLGEPKHAPPDFVLAALADVAALSRDLSSYPATRGNDALRGAIADWIERRFGCHIDPETQTLPVNGTREALFSFAQALLSGKSSAQVMMPNPFYQIYEGAALLAGARPYLLNNDPQTGYQQDFEHVPESVWQDTELVYICSPGNPTGQVIPEASQRRLIELAFEHDFVIAADECYSEIYFDEAAPPGSLLNAAIGLGNDRYERCIVFHSLSKRSNLPGLRSGFVAGDADLIDRYLKYRTYHGCAMSPHHQRASALAWQDEAHVVANRAAYREKFDAVEQILSPHYRLTRPEGGFYHWLPTPGDDTEFARALYAQQHVTVLPGRYLGRGEADNPGRDHVRVAWVAEPDQCIEAATRMAAFLS